MATTQADGGNFQQKQHPQQRSPLSTTSHIKRTSQTHQQSSHEDVSFVSLARGHGSFSAGTVRSPTGNTSPTAANVGGGPGNIGRIGLSSSNSSNANAIADDEDACVTPVEKPAVHRLDASGSVQAIVVDDDVLFAGLQGGEIVVCHKPTPIGFHLGRLSLLTDKKQAWSLHTFEVLTRVHAHQQSVLGLGLSDDRSLLFSSGVDSVVNVWSTRSLQRLYSLESRFEVGDIFSVTYSARTKTLFYGAQNSSIQWYELESSEPSLPSGSRKHRFFDSLGPGGSPASVPQIDRLSGAVAPSGGRLDIVPQENYLQYAHKSYVYAMLTAKYLLEDEPGREVLITAGGGGTIKMWSIEDIRKGKPQLIEKFKNKGSSVFSLAYRAPFLFAGLSNGFVNVYNLASRQLLQKFHVGCGDILQIQFSGGMALCGTSEGWVKKTSNQFTEVDRWLAHQGKILASSIARTANAEYLITGGNDNTIALWNLSDGKDSKTGSVPRSNDELVNTLRQFVSFRTVANNPSYAGECHQAVSFLQKRFNSFGASTSFLSPQGVNPILLAKFQATPTKKLTRTVLFYGHYDVVDADSNDVWHSDPFNLLPLNGYLYGRGVSDNKGPILAALYAVADLAQHDALSCNVVFLLEGDEEAGSRGFHSAVQHHKEEIGPVDFVILSNSYWLDDHIPCITFGMRGVVHASLTVTSKRPDLHSGVDGRSLQHEPLKDMIALLGCLVGESGTDIRIPNFFKMIDKLTPDEVEDYSRITSTLKAGHPEITDEEGFTKSLMQKWRDPSLTVHQVQVPEAKTAVTISRCVKATLSIRIVPNQTADEVSHQLEHFLQSQFSQLHSTNSLKVVITSKADPWLGKKSSDIYQVLKDAVTQVWSSEDSNATNTKRSFPSRTTIDKDTIKSNHHQQQQQQQKERPSHRRGSSLKTTGTFVQSNTPQEPLCIREGGSIPAISFLEKEFDAPAVMFPMGQASDNAHLDNERMRLENLYKGREVLKRVFSRM